MILAEDITKHLSHALVGLALIGYFYLVIITIWDWINHD